jgi:hypothetical protein
MTLKREEEETKKDEQIPEDPPAKRRPYEAPRLEIFGDVRDLTLGNSPGVGESTANGIRKGGPGSG